ARRADLALAATGVDHGRPCSHDRANRRRPPGEQHGNARAAVPSGRARRGSIPPADVEHDSVYAADEALVAVPRAVEGLHVEHVASGAQPPREEVGPAGARTDREEHLLCASPPRKPLARAAPPAAGPAADVPAQSKLDLRDPDVV